MTMTMRQIMAKTVESRKNKSTYVVIVAAKKRATDYGTIVYKAKTYSTHDHLGNPKKNGEPRNTYVSSVETNGKMVVVSCSCGDFWARWEVALNAKRAARIDYSNGERPKETNPKMIPGCCGHIYCLGSALLKKNLIS